MSPGYHSQTCSGFIPLLMAACFIGYLVELPKPKPVTEVTASLPMYQLTGRDENGRQTLEYGYE